jgi:hypothetical protein
LFGELKYLVNSVIRTWDEGESSHPNVLSVMNERCKPSLEKKEAYSIPIMHLPLVDDVDKTNGKYVCQMNNGVVVGDSSNQKIYYTPNIWDLNKISSSKNKNDEELEDTLSIYSLFSTLLAFTLFDVFSVNGPALFACRASRLVAGIDEQVYSCFYFYFFFFFF